MAEMLSPLTWTTPDSRGDESADASAKLGREAFQWPTPPYAIYPAPLALTQPVACQIIGINDQRMVGRLTFFVPDEGVAHVQLPPARTTLPLRFDQFRSLTLMNALLPVTPSEADSQFAALSQPEASTYQIVLKTGGQLVGPTVGHVETEFGLFLFPPQGQSGAVTRMFIPRQAWASFELGPRIDEVLLAQRSVTPQQVRKAVDTQEKLRQQKIGDILVMRQIVSSDQLLAAIDRQTKMPLVRIGEALISLRMVNEQQLKEAIAQQKNDRSVPIGELLVRMGVVSANDLRTALARKMGYPIVNLDLFPIEADALRRLSYSVALRLQVMPLLIREGRLVVAMNDPARRRAAVDEVEFNAQMKVVPVLAHIESLDAALHTAYERIGGASGQRPTPGSGIADNEIATEKLVETLEKEGQDRGDDDKPIEQSDNSLVRLINNMVIEAHRDGVSDIHIESYPGREKIRIRFRKDGLLRTYLELPPNYRNALIARIKIMCDLDISERRKPQDGKINFSKFSAPHKLELRVATIPTNSSLEDVVIRILASAKPMPMDRLDLSETNLTRLKLAIERPYGMVLCVGPTGSGKTTTLHSALSHINVPERKIWTAEDPIEITQPGLRQVQVNPRIDWTFAKALRAFLRADPDVVMVGEIRDSETAQVAIEASLTGHLVMSTLHTNSAPETVTRLLDMGMDPFNFADSLLAVLAQRLVRRLCVACRRSTPATPALIDELLADYMHAFGTETPPVGPDAVLAGWKQRNSRDGRLLAHHSPGCAACDHTGFKGRAGMHELMVISRELRQLIQTGSRAALLQQVALSEGMRTLRQDGIEKVFAGVTTMEEVRATSNI